MIMVLAGHLCEHTPFSSINASIQEQCLTIWSRPCTQGQKLAVSSCMHTILLVLGQSNALYLLLSSCFKMGSDWAKWSTHVHSDISGTQVV